jgi:hypothetical protein
MNPGLQMPFFFLMGYFMKLSVARLYSMTANGALGGIWKETVMDYL